MGGGTSFPVTPLSRDRIIIVTGASSGLGYEIAKWCAMMGATVIMACRSEQKTMEAIEQMNHEFQMEKDKGTSGLTQNNELALEYMHVELTSFKSVVSFTEEFKKSGRKLHVLFLNAGIALGPYRKTEDGFEAVLQVNYLSQFLMTAKLLPIMKQSGEDCRLIMMSSAAANFGNFDINTINYTGRPDKFPKFKYYGNSKLYQLMKMYSMVTYLQATHITVTCIHPGIVDTNIGSERTGCWACMGPCFQFCAAQPISKGARCSIDCATNPNLAGVTGVYFANFKRLQPPSDARNKTNQDQLWNQTWEYLDNFVTDSDRAIMEGR